MKNDINIENNYVLLNDGEKNMTIFEHILEPNHENDFIQNFEPEPLTDEDLCRLEQEVFQTISEETLAKIYTEIHK